MGSAGQVLLSFNLCVSDYLHLPATGSGDTAPREEAANCPSLSSTRQSFLPTRLGSLPCGSVWLSACPADRLAGVFVGQWTAVVRWSSRSST